MMAQATRVATEQDFTRIAALLRAHELPTADLADSRPEFIVIEEGGTLVGIGGLERFGEFALLRSLVVAKDRQKAGLGSKLLAELEQQAVARGVREVVLLTQTAEAFFARHGYAPIERSGVPQSIRATAEFRSLCPASAACMSKRLVQSRFTGLQPMNDRPYNVLFLCTGNSARSILAEALVNHLGAGKLKGFSAGSHPKGAVHPIALELLKHMNLPTDGLRSKSWDEFAQSGAPKLDFIFTVCDNAAGEVCPVWPGHPMTAHWGVDDPAAVEGSDADKWIAFRETFRELESRIKVFVSLPLASIDRMKLKQRVDEIGRTGDV